MKTELVSVSGNTYPVKDQIKALGGRWDADRKVWLVAADKVAAAEALVAGAGPKRAWTPSSSSAGSSAGGSDGYRPGLRCYCAECGDPYRAGRRCWETGMACTPSWE